MVKLLECKSKHLIYSKTHQGRHQVFPQMLGKDDAGHLLEVIFQYQPNEQPEEAKAEEVESHIGSHIFWLDKPLQVANQPCVIWVCHKEGQQQAYEPRFLLDYPDVFI